MFMIIMKVLWVEIPVKEEVFQVRIEWTRGDFKREGKKRLELNPDNYRKDVDEIFLKMSAFKRKANGSYKIKNAIFTVTGLNHLGKVKFLGEIEVELSQYLNKGYLAEKTFILHKSVPNSLLAIDVIIAPYVKDQKIRDYLPKELSSFEENKNDDQD